MTIIKSLTRSRNTYAIYHLLYDGTTLNEVIKTTIKVKRRDECKIIVTNNATISIEIVFFSVSSSQLGAQFQTRHIKGRFNETGLCNHNPNGA